MSENNVSSTGGHSGILDDGNDNEPVNQIEIAEKPVNINGSEVEPSDDTSKKGRKIDANTG